MEIGKALEVYTVVERPRNTSLWVRVGTAHVNADGTIGVELNALPLTGKLVIREPRPFDPPGKK